MSSSCDTTSSSFGGHRPDGDGKGEQGEGEGGAPSRFEKVGTSSLPTHEITRRLPEEGDGEGRMCSSEPAGTLATPEAEWEAYIVSWILPWYENQTVGAKLQQTLSYQCTVAFLMASRCSSAILKFHHECIMSAS